MGGYNSGRWSWHLKKTQAEECAKLTIFFLKPYLQPGNWSTVRWSRGGQETGSISYRVLGDDHPTGLRLIYTIGAKSGHPEDFNYLVSLTTTPLPWGGVRYWFECPLQGCTRRVGCLYLPPGGKYFGCRHCYNLTYESRQEGSSSRSFFNSFAGEMQDVYPGINGKDVRALLDDKETPHFARLEYEQYLREMQDYDPYERYLTLEELCRQSGLGPEDLSRLETARLLLPDTKDGRYRPKLTGWGKKMAYLLGEGWGIEEIQAWAKGRWKTENPRQWPPAKKS
jgi:hypothetical protein